VDQEKLHEYLSLIMVCGSGYNVGIGISWTLTGREVMGGTGSSFCEGMSAVIPNLDLDVTKNFTFERRRKEKEANV
jgi:hypothetical protein